MRIEIREHWQMVRIDVRSDPTAFRPPAESGQDVIDPHAEGAAQHVGPAREPENDSPGRRSKRGLLLRLASDGEPAYRQC